MTKRWLLVLGVVVGCQVADPNPAAIPAGGSGGTSTAGVSAGGTAGAAPGAAGKGGAAGIKSDGGAAAEAGNGGSGDVANEGGAAGDNATPEGGAGGEGGGPADGCASACSSTQTCVAGACEDQDCPPSASFCSGASLRACAADGLSSVPVTTCGVGKYCEPVSASCKQGYTMCSNIYLGSGRFGANPLPVSQANDAIVMLDYDVKVNTNVGGQVRVNNLGTNDSPSTHIELYLSEAPAFVTNNNRLLFETNAVIPGAAQAGEQGEYTVNWLYTFTTPGRYVLLARIENNSVPTGAACTKQGYDLSSPATNAQTAIHYVNVVE